MNGGPQTSQSCQGRKQEPGWVTAGNVGEVLKAETTQPEVCLKFASFSVKSGGVFAEECVLGLESL